VEEGTAVSPVGVATSETKEKLGRTEVALLGTGTAPVPVG
jgi:hypothetical protein